MEAHVNIKATPAELDVIRRALAARIVAQEEIGRHAGHAIIGDITPQARRDAAAEALQAKAVLERLQ